MTQQAAGAAIVAAQLTVGNVTTQTSLAVAAGRVISQSPAAGASVAANSAVNLVISTGAAPSLAWSYPAGSAITGASIEQTADGGFIVGGGNGGDSMYALKLSAAGAKQWDRTYSNMTTTGTPSELWPYTAAGIRETTDGYVLLGAGHNEGDLLPVKSYLLVKVNSLGVVQSSQAYAPENPYSVGNLCVNNNGRALQVTGDGGFMAVGDSYVGMYPLASILKTDVDGDVEFLKVINDNARDYDQVIMAGQQTSDDGYVLAGYSANGADAGYLALLIKLDDTGALEWSKQYNYPPQDYGAEGLAVTQTADGGYLISGLLINSILNNKVLNHGCWIAKVDSSGDEVWSRWYGNVTTVRTPYATLETPDGGFLATGDLSGHLVLSKFDALGNPLWNYEVTDVSLPGKAMVLTSDGGCAILASGISGGAVVVKINHVFVP